MWATVAVTAAVGVPGYLALRHAGGGDAPRPTSTTGSAPAQLPPAVPSRSTGTGVTAADPATGCADAVTRAPVACDADGAGLPVPVTPCTTDAVLARWGLDPDSDALLLTTSAGRGGCLVAPAPAARTAGATTLDLARLPARPVPAALRACALRGGAVTVTCADVHTLEWIGGWRHHGMVADTDVCLRAARSYTDSTLVGADSPLDGVAVERAQGAVRMFRCAVGVRDGRLDGTVAGLGGQPLPTLP